MLIIQRNASLASLIQQIHRSDPISNSSDLEGLIVEPLHPSSKSTEERDLDTTNEYDVASRDGKYVIVKPEGESTVWYKLRLGQDKQTIEYKPDFFENILPGLEVYKPGRMISTQLRALTPSDGSKLDRLMAGYWAYSYPNNQYSELKDIQIFTPLKPYVRGLAESTNMALQLLTQVVITSLLVSNFLAKKLTDEWVAILPRKITGAQKYDLEELYKQSPIAEISSSVDTINERTSEIISAKKQIECLNAMTQRQLSTASEIQRFFLTKIFPDGLSYEVIALTRPAYDVGGDWYDTFSVGKHSFFVVADVCDKGVGSALFMSVFRTLIRYSTRFSFRDENVADIERVMVDVISDVNQYMSANHGDSAYFATVFFGHLHEDTSQLSYVSAGHEAVLIRKAAGVFAELEATGPALGIFDGAIYNGSTTSFCAGEKLLAYSDGVIDARNPLGDSYGISRLKNYFDRFGGYEIAEMQDALLHELDEFMDESEQFDDITMMFVKRIDVIK